MPKMCSEKIDGSMTEIPRDLIIVNFQQTSFQIGDYFLEIHCNLWKDL